MSLISHATITGTDLHVTGPFPYRAVSSTPITLLQTDGVMLVDATGGGIVLDLPSAAAMPKGQWYRIKKSDSSANLVTINANGGDLIEGEGSQILGTQYQWTLLVGDGISVWWRFF